MGTLEDTTYGMCKIDSKNRITLSPRVMNFLNLISGDLISIEKDNNSLCLHKAYICVKRNKNNVGGGDAEKEGKVGLC